MMDDGRIDLIDARLDRWAWTNVILARFPNDEEHSVLRGVAWALADRAAVDGLLDRVHWVDLAASVFALSREQVRQEGVLELVQTALEVLEAEGFLRPIGVSGFALTIPMTIPVES